MDQPANLTLTVNLHTLKKANSRRPVGKQVTKTLLKHLPHLNQDELNSIVTSIDPAGKLKLTDGHLTEMFYTILINIYCELADRTPQPDSNNPNTIQTITLKDLTKFGPHEDLENDYQRFSTLGKLAEHIPGFGEQHGIYKAEPTRPAN